MKYRENDYSIIIPFSKNELVLEMCLKALNETVPEKVEKIIVINTKDQENNLTAIKGNSVNIIHHTKEIGYSKAINEGAKLAKGKFLIFCDADTYCLNNWIHCLSDFYNSKKNVGIACSKLLCPTSGRVVDFGIAFTDYNITHPGMDRLPNFPLLNENKKVQAACSAIMMMEKNLFFEIGMFNESLYYHYMDVELCLRLKKYNLECWVVAASQAYHRGSYAHRSCTHLSKDTSWKFMANNSRLIEVDMQKYFIDNLQFFRSSNNIIKKNYVLIGFSTIINPSWYYKIIEEFLEVNFVEYYEYPDKSRDNGNIYLFDFLTLEFLRFHNPILYFVDRFISLKENTIIKKLRDISSDIVIDRNGNIDLLRNIITSVL